MAYCEDCKNIVAGGVRKHMEKVLQIYLYEKC